jgi:hypothetical protein
MIIPQVNHGFLIEKPNAGEWDFPRIADNYFEDIAEWLHKQVSKPPQAI